MKFLLRKNSYNVHHNTGIQPRQPQSYHWHWALLSLLWRQTSSLPHCAVNTPVLCSCALREDTYPVFQGCSKPILCPRGSLFLFPRLFSIQTSSKNMVWKNQPGFVLTRHPEIQEIFGESSSTNILKTLMF